MFGLFRNRRLEDLKFTTELNRRTDKNVSHLAGTILDLSKTVSNLIENQSEILKELEKLKVNQDKK